MAESLLCVCACVCTHTHVCVHACAFAYIKCASMQRPACRSQFSPPPCRSQRLDSDHRAWGQAPLPTEASCRPSQTISVNPSLRNPQMDPASFQWELRKPEYQQRHREQNYVHRASDRMKAIPGARSEAVHVTICQRIYLNLLHVPRLYEKPGLKMMD